MVVKTVDDSHCNQKNAAHNKSGRNIDHARAYDNEQHAEQQHGISNFLHDLSTSQRKVRTSHRCSKVWPLRPRDHPHRHHNDAGDCRVDAPR